MTQLMMAGPLLGLFEISIWVAKIFGKKSPVEETDEDNNKEDKEESGTITPTKNRENEVNQTEKSDHFPGEDKLSPEEESELIDKT